MLSGFVRNDPVNFIDPEGLWSIGGSYYSGVGGSLKFGRSNGRWFIRGSVGFGLGGGIQYTPIDGFPGEDTDPCEGTIGFLGASANAEANLGPLSGALEGYAGGHIGQGPNGRPHLNYTEAGGLEGSLTGQRGWGIKGEVSINVDAGVAW